MELFGGKYDILNIELNSPVSEAVPYGINTSEHRLQKGEGKGTGLRRGLFSSLEPSRKGSPDRAAVAGGLWTLGKEVLDDRKES